MMKSILFVSSTRTWAGSEVLWSETAAALADKGYNVKFAVRYTHPVIQKLQSKGAVYIDTSKADFPSFGDKVLRKLKLKEHPFAKGLAKHKPQLVFINLSNNIQGEYYLTACRQYGVPYVTLIHLVPENLWPFYEDDYIDGLRTSYARSQANYFVSRANLDQHHIMIGDEHPNAKVVSNPFTVRADLPDKYPAVTDGQYNIAMVGRLETFHKGHDLLLQVLKQPKWKNRPVTLNIYGAGPHQKLLERLIAKFDLTNVFLKGHVQNVSDIWRTNHLLVMPSRMEGQALVLIEAMWCYRTAVLTDVGGARELIADGETGFIADYPSVTAIDHALEKAWSLREQWEEMGRAAGRTIREIYQTDPVELFTEEVKKIFDKVAGV
ncbi:MAG TPA: glycosyltransferase family 4 protein [Chitinophagaceae bacterium]|nr:glycosyltransferase family 4 protein [Chitinophagaceae bacterium]